MPNLALIDKDGQYRSPPKFHNFGKHTTCFKVIQHTITRKLAF